uniref:Peptidase S8/S53 domain-containing protein n=1 Tax=Quercus lobata TaxID=97700 RepID=A0A7N2MDL2_QUELO
MHLIPSKMIRDSFKHDYLVKLEWNLERMKRKKQSQKQKLLNNEEEAVTLTPKPSSEICCGPRMIILVEMSTDAFAEQLVVETILELDNDGHGTHMASTAAGSPVGNTSLLGYAQGMACGMASRSRVAAYKVCWSVGCFGSDILAGMDQAISDGMDVLSLSLYGGSALYYRDTITIGAFKGVEKGIFVSCSAGNGGPIRASLANVAPWIMTVGAVLFYDHLLVLEPETWDFVLFLFSSITSLLFLCLENHRPVDMAKRVRPVLTRPV